MQLGAARRRLLDAATASAGRRSASACEDVAGAQRLAVGGRRRAPAGGAARAAASRRAGATRAASAAQTAAGGAEQRELGRAAVRLRGVVGDHGDARARLDERARLVRVVAERAGADGERRGRGGASVSRSRAGAAGRWPANSGWSCGKPARRAERLLPDGAAEALGERDERGPASRRRRRPRRRRARARAPRRSASASSSTAPGVGRRGAQQARRRRRPRACRRPARVPVVHRHDDERRAAPRRASCQARAIVPGTSCARAGRSRHTG